jgi:hypothetical protein
MSGYLDAVFGEAHLRRILGKYAVYYNESRIHRSLHKDPPFHRAIEHLGMGAKRQPCRGQIDQRSRCDKMTVAHSTTSSARARRVAGTSMPIARAVLRLIMNL